LHRGAEDGRRSFDTMGLPRLVSGTGETGLLFLRVTMSQGRIGLADVQPNFRKDLNTYFLHQDKVSFSNWMNSNPVNHRKDVAISPTCFQTVLLKFRRSQYWNGPHLRQTHKTLVFFLTSPEVLQPSRKRNVQVNHFPSLHLSYSCLCESSTARVGTVRWYRLE